MHFIRVMALAALAALGGSAGAGAAQDDGGIPQQYVDIAKSLQPQHGRVTLGDARASLDLGQNYDFYGPGDSKKILEDLWGNPPGSAQGVLGLVMPAGHSPLSDSWGAVITYEDSGYVSDRDAADVDYGEILDNLKENAKQDNEDRAKAGYPTVDVVGWAESPHYDKGTHSVVWARDLRFKGDQVDSLNYDLRTLGRHGVLSVNFVSMMPELQSIRAAAEDFATHAHFDAGARYEDFDSSTDKEAAYGIGGLVAAGVGVAAAKKLGFLAIILKFGKVIALGAVAAFAAAWKWIKGLFGIKSGDDYEE